MPRWKLPRRKLPLRSRHIRYARSTRGEKSLSFFQSHTLDELEEMAYEEIRRKNYRIVRRDQKMGGLTLAFTIYLDDDFDKRSQLDRVALLWHELQHAWQWRRGHMLRYLDDRWRWALEVPAHRQQFKVLLAHGVSKRRIEKLVRELPRKFASKRYRIDKVPMRNLELKTRECIMEHLED